uniref:Peptidase S74 domain-containing protein n=1 Tax=viral metagenome TaxID=1070528 RepID=A0A6C0KPJ1_9ZZZZ
MSSNNIGSIYATTISSEKYIIIASQNIELSGNIIINNNLQAIGNVKINGNLDASNVYTKNQVYSKPEIDNSFTNVYTKNQVYSKPEIDNSFTNVYTKNQVYSKSQIDASLSNVYTNSLDVCGNVTFRGSTLYVPSSFTIDPFGYEVNTGTVVINGNLVVQGETTTINSSVVDISDKILVLASNASNSLHADGAGFEISGAKVNLLYNNSSNTFRSSIGMSISGNVVPVSNGVGSLGETGKIWDIAYIRELNVTNFTNSIDGAKIANGTISSTQIENGSILTVDISDHAITHAKLSSDCIQSHNIVDGTIMDVDISANAAIAFSKINASLAITDTHISATAAISGSKIANTTITATQIANATITATQIANTTITGTQIANASITSDKINQTNNWTFSQLTSTTANIRDVSATNIEVSGNIVPLLSITSNLGSSLKRWSKIFANDLSINTINGQSYSGGSSIVLTSVASNIIPSGTNTYNLGSTTQFWKNAYINDICGGNIYSKTEVDSSLLTILNTNHYTKQYGNNLWNQIGGNLSFSTTNALFGISNNGRVVGLTVPAFNSNIGRLYVYEISFNGTSYSWETLGVSSEIMVGQTTTDLFGGTGNSKLAFSSDGRIVAVSSTRNDTSGTDTGQIRVFELSANVWTQRGQSINGKPIASYQLGFNVALSGNGNILVAVSNSNYGEILAYELSNNIWIRMGEDITGSTYTDQPGWGALGGYNLGWACALSLDGTTIIAGFGAMNNGSIYYAGRANIYRYNNTTRLWDNIGTINGLYNRQYFGWQVSISSDGNTIAVGSRYTNGVSNPSILQDCGSIIVYKYNGGTSWTQIGQTIFGTAINETIAGVWVSISNDGTIISFSTSLSVKVFKLYANSWYQIGQSINRVWDFPGGQLLACALSGDGTTFIHQQFFSNSNNRCTVYGMDKLLALNDLFASSLTINNNIVPFVNNTSSLGTSAIRWSNIFTTNLNVNGTSYDSDDRLKHNEVIITNGLEIIDRLTPKFYQKTLTMLDASYNGDLSGHNWSYETGLIAQELLQIPDLSFAVSGGDYYEESHIYKRQTNDPSNANYDISNANYDISNANYDICYNLIPQTYNVNYNAIFVYGLAAIKELHAKVKAQELSLLSQQTIINSLTTRMEALETNPNNS